MHFVFSQLRALDCDGKNILSIDLISRHYQFCIVTMTHSPGCDADAGAGAGAGAVRSSVAALAATLADPSLSALHLSRMVIVLDCVQQVEHQGQ